MCVSVCEQRTGPSIRAKNADSGEVSGPDAGRSRPLLLLLRLLVRLVRGRHCDRRGEHLLVRADAERLQQRRFVHLRQTRVLHAIQSSRMVTRRKQAVEFK